MAQNERYSKRTRRQPIADSEEDTGTEESGDDWEPPSSGTIRVGGKNAAPSSTAATMSRPRRAAAVTPSGNEPSSVTVSRSPSHSPEDRRKSIRLTVKLPSSKLREVMTEREVASLKDSLTPGVDKVGVVTGHLRSSGRNTQKKRYVEYAESEDVEDEDEEEVEEEEEEEEENEENEENEEEEEEEEDDDDENEENEEEDEPMNDFDVIGAEAEGSEDEGDDGEGDEDMDMDDSPLPPPPKIKIKPTTKANGRPGKPTLVVTPATNGPVKSVEEKEMELDPDDDEDEELSELNSDAEDEEEEQDETNIGEDGEGDEELEDEEDGEGEDEELDGDEGMDSDDDSGVSGGGTPKLTKRQRGEIEDDGGFLALPMEPQIKKHFTAEEHRMRRAEMARRRKNLSEKRNAEEKKSTIDKLLKKQTAKRRGASARSENVAAAISAEAADEGSPEEEYIEKPNPLFTRWISNQNGIRLGVPEEWLGKHVGAVFGPVQVRPNGKLVQELI